jgi:hypothetical protein
MKQLFSIIIVFIFFGLISTTHVGCKKDCPNDTTAKADSIIPKPIIDTPIYISKLERGIVYGVSSNMPSIRIDDTYSFYYDNNKRLIQVGLRIASYGIDTATCRISYSGNSKNPSRIISLNLYQSLGGQTLVYDTTDYTYNANGQLVKDTSSLFAFDHTSGLYYRMPAKRTYSYQDSTKVIIQKYAVYNFSVGLQIIRSDTIEQSSPGVLTRIWSQFYGAGTRKINAALVYPGDYSDFVNPLSRLNLPRNIVSSITSPSHKDLLGSEFAIDNSNVIESPLYLDFYSNKLTSSLGIYSYWLGEVRFPTFMFFSYQIRPYPAKTSYPASLSFAITSNNIDSIIYQYSYIR